MSACIVTLIDESTNCGEGVYSYDNEALAYTKLRRSVRDAYIAGEISDDWIVSHSFAVVGSFHFGPYGPNKDEDGMLEAYTAIAGYSQIDWIVWPCCDFVSDLYKGGDEDDAS